jgi:DhnA family fructose-bisphosphate aldolase class Ia
MKEYRLNRLFNGESGRCLDVAVDHGFFGEAAFLTGIENMDSVVSTLIDASPDAIQLTVGQAELLQRRPGRDKPALVLRTDIANVYGRQLPDRLFSRMIAQPVEQAVRLDAACVVVNIFDIPDQPGVREACIGNVLALKPLCDQVAMPLMIEPLVMRPSAEAGGYTINGDADKIIALVRQAVELGADVIKADPTDNISEYHRVVEVARKPLLVRGGGKVSDAEILKRTHAVLAQGARGIVYGRNIIQHVRPAAITRALMAVVHESVEPPDALRMLETEDD